MGEGIRREELHVVLLCTVHRFDVETWPEDRPTLKDESSQFLCSKSSFRFMDLLLEQGHGDLLHE